jgi:uncharacterized protein YneF (UPF0154 family)
MKDTINDCYVDLFGKRPSEDKIVQIYEQLSSDIKLLADQWGWNDTEVGDMVYKWIKENKEKIS